MTRVNADGMKVSVMICSTALFLICTLSNAVFADPVGIWLFEEGSGNVVSDSSENGNDGEIIGKADWVEGRFGEAISLPGTVGNYIRIPDSPTLNPDRQISMMMWVRPDASSYVTLQSRLFSKHNPGSDYGFQMLNGGTFTLMVWTPAFAQVVSKAVLSADEWQHVAGTYDGREMTLIVYHNAEKVGEVVGGDGGAADTAEPLLLGTMGDQMHWYAGVMDDAAMFDTALTADEIAEIYQLGLKHAVLAVSASGKLAVTWGAVKDEY